MTKKITKKEAIDTINKFIDDLKHFMLSHSERVRKEEAYLQAKQAKPLVCMDFPNNEKGRASLNSLRNWLDILEQNMGE